MARAAIATHWIGGPGTMPENAYRPAILDDIDAGITWHDITEQQFAQLPPRPNMFIVEVDCSDAILAAIKAHAQYGNAAVLWEGDPSRSPVVTTAQYNALVTFLANKFGATATQVRNLLGATANGRTRAQIANQIVAYLQARPRG